MGRGLEPHSPAATVSMEATVCSVYNQKEAYPNRAIDNSQCHREPKRQFKESIHNQNDVYFMYQTYYYFRYKNEIGCKGNNNFSYLQTIATLFCIFSSKKCQKSCFFCKK